MLDVSANRGKVEMPNLRNGILRKFLIGVLAFVALGYGWYVYNYPTCTFRYKLTAEVMTPDGLKTGSSVIEVSYSSTNPLPNPGRWRADTVTGEAVYVDLGKGKNLFVLFGARGSGRTPWQIPWPEGPNEEPNYTQMNGAIDQQWLPVKIFKLGRIVGAEQEMSRRLAETAMKSERVPLNNLPTLATFTDLSKPTSFRVLDPERISDGVGAGYKLEQVTIKITKENPTPLVRVLLPWMFTDPKGGARIRVGIPGEAPISDLVEWYFLMDGYSIP
jgi:hypothetical protein